MKKLVFLEVITRMHFLLFANNDKASHCSLTSSNTVQTPSLTNANPHPHAEYQISESDSTSKDFKIVPYCRMK